MLDRLPKAIGFLSLSESFRGHDHRRALYAFRQHSRIENLPLLLLPDPQRGILRRRGR
jgi:hypothetical protein